MHICIYKGLSDLYHAVSAIYSMYIYLYTYISLSLSIQFLKIYIYIHMWIYIYKGPYHQSRPKTPEARRTSPEEARRRARTSGAEVVVMEGLEDWGATYTYTYRYRYIYTYVYTYMYIHIYVENEMYVHNTT